MTVSDNIYKYMYNVVNNYVHQTLCTVQSSTVDNSALTIQYSTE